MHDVAPVVVQVAAPRVPPEALATEYPVMGAPPLEAGAVQ